MHINHPFPHLMLSCNRQPCIAGQVGQIQGAHGIKGEVKVRSLTDFAINRLCTPGIKHIKAPNRRFPRDVELIAGRWQKEEIFLLKLEVSCVALLWKASKYRVPKTHGTPSACFRMSWLTCSRFDSIQSAVDDLIAGVGVFDVPRRIVEELSRLHIGW